MLEILQEKIKSEITIQAKTNLIREFLQILILKILSDNKDFNQIVFIGGTALRILYKLKRYSEDLDFYLYSQKDYDFKKTLKKIQDQLEKLNFQVEFKYKQGVVDSAMINFIGVLQELDLHQAKDQKLSIKLEIDTNPPQGGNIETTLVHEDFMFPVKHYDLSSLMAGKLHAVLCRKFEKGRDYYDLIWYLTQKIEPNLILLNNAIIQTEKQSLNLTSKNWKKTLLKKLQNLDFEIIKKDVQRFLMRPEEIDLISLQNFQKLLQNN